MDEIHHDFESFLMEARQRAQEGSPKSLRIRSLVQRFGAERRGANVVSHIEAALERHGLVTEPPFTSGWIDNTVRVDLRPEDNPVEEQLTDGSGSAGSQEVSLTVSSLESASRTVAYVQRNQTLEHARSLMLAHDYSQLAVASGSRNIVGAVSWESMAKAALSQPEFSLKDATIPVMTVGKNDNLIALVPHIVERGFVFVLGHDKQLCGIVTTADLGDQFATLAKPFFLIGEAERRLRHVVDAAFRREELVGIRDPDDVREVSTAGDLTLGEIQRLLEKRENWEKLGWPVDQSVFIRQLDSVREIRNEVMHFSPDPLSSEQIETVANFIKWLAVHDPR